MNMELLEGFYNTKYRIVTIKEAGKKIGRETEDVKCGECWRHPNPKTKVILMTRTREGTEENWAYCPKCALRIYNLVRANLKEFQIFATLSEL